MFLSFQMIFSQDTAYVTCAILDRISDFEPSSVTIVLALVDCFKSPIINPDVSCDAFCIVRHHFVFSAFITMPNALAVLLRYLMSSFSSFSLPARPSISSVDHRLVMTLPPILTVPHGCPEHLSSVSQGRC